MSNTHPLTTTAFDLPGYRVTRNLGVVRGIIVRSRSVIGNLGASLQTLVGGNITVYTSLCERTRSDAFQLMRARGRTGRQRRDRRALRRHRDRAGRHRGALLRHGGVRGGGRWSGARQQHNKQGLIIHGRSQ